ncbi:MAG: hypothetical protein ACKV19_21955 [Verrucomicrobiales bacterium]
MVRVGRLGDTEAIQAIMARLHPEGPAGGCLMGSRPPHAREALQDLSGHDAGPKAEDWHAWWRLHHGKSQFTLIRESFLPLGVDPRKPPTKEQTVKLLRLIGLAHQIDGGAPVPRPTRARVSNALRILRDHEIKPEVVTLADLAGSDGQAILDGLTAYTTFQAEHPADNGVGVVFGQHASATPFSNEYLETHSWILRSVFAPWAWFGGAMFLAISGLWGAWKLAARSHSPRCLANSPDPPTRRVGSSTPEVT